MNIGIVASVSSQALGREDASLALRDRAIFLPRGK